MKYAITYSVIRTYTIYVEAPSAEAARKYYNDGANVPLEDSESKEPGALLVELDGVALTRSETTPEATVDGNGQVVEDRVNAKMDALADALKGVRR